MGYATLGFPGGPAIQFRIDPSRIDWSFQINTSVTNTVGGRVVQVNGATLSDVVISGLYGERRDQSAAPGEANHPGVSWELARRFEQKIRELMDWQSRDANLHQRMHQTAIFEYQPKGWKFRVYLKDFKDPDGGGTVTMRPGKFSHGYTLTLFVVQDDSTKLIEAGSVNGVIDAAKKQAIDSYISRISSGIGWKPTIYNGNFGNYYDGIFDKIRGNQPRGGG